MSCNKENNKALKRNIYNNISEINSYHQIHQNIKKLEIILF